jgi:cell division protein FtsB
MKLLFAFIVFVIGTLQYQLWFGDYSIRALNMLEVDLEVQRRGNADLIERNRLVEIEVLDLKNGLEAVEEVFYLIVD